jgi:hypothetical protein
MIKITLGIALAIDCSNVVITIVLLGDLGTKIAAARDPHELAITNLQLIGTVAGLWLLNNPAGMTRRSSEEKISSNAAELYDDEVNRSIHPLSCCT